MVSESAFFTGMTNPSGDSVTGYAFWDGGTGNGHLTVGGVAQTDGHWIIVAAAQLSGVSYVGGSRTGSENLFVDAYDATTGTWTAYAGLTATTTALLHAKDNLLINAIASLAPSSGAILGASAPDEPQSNTIPLAPPH